MAALANPSDAKYSYIDPLSLMCSPEPGAWVPNHSLLSQDVDINPSCSDKTTFSCVVFVDLSLEEDAAG